MKTNLKLKLLAVALVTLFASQQTFAQNVPAVLAQTGTGLTTISLTSGQSFSLDLNITTGFISNGITWFLQSTDASGFFTIATRSVVGCPWTDLTTLDGTFFGGTAPVLNPVNDFDIGTTGNNVAAGNYFIATLGFNMGALAPGTYHISLDSRGIVSDSTFTDHAINANVMTIVVVPEPATTGLAVLGGVMLLAFVWRARRVMA